MDFVLPGTEFTAAQPVVSKQLEPYYNAGGNSHDSYKVTTDAHAFWVDEHFAREIGEETIVYWVSPLFQEVTGHRLQSVETTHISRLRWLSGLILPLIALLFFALTLFHKVHWPILTFVLQLLLLADLIYLVLG